MKQILLTIAVLVGIFATTSCQKEELQKSSEESVLHFSASIEPGTSTKTTVEKVDGTTVSYKTKWVDTDCIKIEGATYQATPNSTDATKADFTKTSGADPTATPYKAYYPASMFDGTTATLPASYTYAEGEFNMPMYAESTNNNLLFKNLCGVLAITIPSTQISSVSSITVISDKQMNGAFIADKTGVLTFTSEEELTDADKKITMTFSTAKTIESSATFFIPVPAGTHNPLTINVSNGTIERTMVTKQSGGVEVVRNTVYPIVFADNQPDILLGLFSVSATKQVRFSKGNLYYENSAFNFEANQYTYSYSSSHCGLFRWAANSGTLSNDISSAISIETSLTGETSDVFFTNATETTPRDGFTVAGQAGWRTLSSDEWKNLIGCIDAPSPRTNASSLYKYGVTVCGTSNCLIIAPDGYDYTKFQTEYSKSSTPLTWSQAETQGLVCLPAAGCRNGSGVICTGDYGFYLSSMPYDSYSAYCLGFFNTTADVGGSSRGLGISVRLVRE